MTSFDTEMNILIQNYLKDYKRQELTLEEMDQRPRYKRVWFWWMALAHFNINHHYKRLEFVPSEIHWIHVTNKEMSTSYTWDKNKYRKVQGMSYEDCKAIYQK